MTEISIGMKRLAKAKQVREDAETTKIRAQQLAKAGYSTKSIAEELGISEGTVLNISKE